MAVESQGVDDQVAQAGLSSVVAERGAYGTGRAGGFVSRVGGSLDTGEFEQAGDELAASAVRCDGVVDSRFDVVGETILGHERFEASADDGDRGP